MPGIDFLSNRRTAIRSIPNPMDKSTVFSIYPVPVLEKKLTIQPGTFFLEAGSYDKPSCLVVGSSSWWIDRDPEQPLLEMVNGSVQVAESIVTDYIAGMLACDMGERRPGLFWLPGAVSVKELKAIHPGALDLAVKRQKNWYNELVRLADAMFSRTNGNPVAISDDQRRAAKELGLDRVWSKDYEKLDLAPCPACGQLRNNNFPVCTHCKTIVDMKKFEALNLKVSA